MVIGLVIVIVLISIDAAKWLSMPSTQQAKALHMGDPSFTGN